MRKSLLILLLSFHGLWAQPLFQSEGLYQWYQALYSYQAVDLNSEWLQSCSPIERDFAALNYHWWELLNGAEPQIQAAQIEALSNRYLHSQKAPQRCNSQELFMAAISSSMQARVKLIENSALSSARAYYQAIPYLELILQRRDDFDEYELLALIYDACLNEVEGRLSYLPLILILPDAKDQNAFEKLSSWQSANPLCQVEANYFAYKIALSLKEQPQEAMKYLDRLLEMHPANLIFRMEKIRLLKQLGLPLAEAENAFEQALNQHNSPQLRRHFRSLSQES